MGMHWVVGEGDSHVYFDLILGDSWAWLFRVLFSLPMPEQEAGDEQAA